MMTASHEDRLLELAVEADGGGAELADDAFAVALERVRRVSVGVGRQGSDSRRREKACKTQEEERVYNASCWTREEMGRIWRVRLGREKDGVRRNERQKVERRDEVRGGDQ